ncbi:MAG: type II toxin-antitoxin system HicB family antitoxin [bacterium]
MSDFTVVLEREDDGRYSAYVPDLPGCASAGDTKREALANVREAIACYLEGLHKLGRPKPMRRTQVEVVRVRAA